MLPRRDSIRLRFDCGTTNVREILEEVECVYYIIFMNVLIIQSVIDIIE